MEINGIQVLDVAGLNLLVGKMKDGTLVCGKANEVPASGISGTIPLSALPHAALERLIVVATESARLALTDDDVQNGDSVKVTETGKMYAVVDHDQLGTEAAFTEYSVGRAAVAALAEAVAWSNVTGKPSVYPPETHVHGANQVNAMTGYSKPASTSAITQSDTLNGAIGKLEKGIEQVNENITPIPDATILSIINGTYET